MECPACGKPVDVEAKFCTNCGAKLESVQKPMTPPTTTTSPSGQSVFSGKEYIIEQKIAAMRDTFGIKDRNGNLLAYGKKKIVSWGPQFWFETPDGTRVGEMRGKVLAVRPTFEIYDPQGLVGVVKKKVMKLLGSEWWLEDNSGNEIGRIKGNITEHDFSVRSPSGSEVAQVHKKWVNIRDSYGIELTSEEISPYVVVAYVIAMDHAEWKGGKGFALGAAGIGLGSTMGDFRKI
jgi:uncharacterized protein YxjI